MGRFCFNYQILQPVDVYRNGLSRTLITNIDPESLLFDKNMKK